MFVSAGNEKKKTKDGESGNTLESLLRGWQIQKTGMLVFDELHVSRLLPRVITKKRELHDYVLI